MSETLKALGVDKMTAEERHQLIGEIWATFADDPDSLPPFTDAEKAELERRLARMKENPTAVYTLEQVTARHRRPVE